MCILDFEWLFHWPEIFSTRIISFLFITYIHLQVIPVLATLYSRLVLPFVLNTTGFYSLFTFLQIQNNLLPAGYKYDQQFLHASFPKQTPPSLQKLGETCLYWSCTCTVCSNLCTWPTYSFSWTYCCNKNFKTDMRSKIDCIVYVFIPKNLYSIQSFWIQLNHLELVNTKSQEDTASESDAFFKSSFQFCTHEEFFFEELC